MCTSKIKVVFDVQFSNWHYTSLHVLLFVINILSVLHQQIAEIDVNVQKMDHFMCLLGF